MIILQLSTCSPGSDFLQTLNAEDPDGSVPSVPTPTYVIYGTEDWHPGLRTLDSFFNPSSDMESGDAIDAAKALAGFYLIGALTATLAAILYEQLAAYLRTECGPFLDCEIDFGLYGVTPIENPMSQAFFWEQHASVLRSLTGEMLTAAYNIRFRQGQEWERDIVGSTFPNPSTWGMSDGVVPQSSSTGVPGIPPNRILPRVEGANHLELRVRNNAIDRIRTGLRRVGVPER